MTRKIKLSILVLVCLSLFQITRAQYKIGQWVDYLPYTSSTSITKGNGVIYAATGVGAFSININDNSYNRLNKVQGLNDVGVALIKYNTYNNTLLVVYGNSNMDVLKNNTITNFSDIKRKNITADKTIYNISFYKEYAYLSTGFGIVVFDTDKLEFKDTYIIGNAGAYLPVYDVTRNNDSIFAATQSGLKVALTSGNLSDFQNWSNDASLPSGAYNNVERFGNYFLANYSSKLTNGTNYKDTLFIYNGISWSLYPKGFMQPGSQTYEIKTINSDEANQRFVLTDQWSVESYQYNGSGFSAPVYYGNNLNFPDQNGNPIWPASQEAIYVPEFGPNNYIIATQGLGVVRTDGANNYRLLIDGPATKNANQLALESNKLLVAPVFLSEVLFPQYQSTGAYTMHNGSWNNLLKSNVTSLVDINCAAFEKGNPDHYYFGSWGDGVAEFRNDTLYKVHDETNSSLQPATTTSNSARVGGIACDTSGVTWCTNSLTSYILHAKKPNGTWVGLNFNTFVNYTTVVGKLMIDRNNQKWIQLPGIGFVVYNGSNYQQPNSSNTRLITTTAGSGSLPSAQVFAMCEDKEGDIWIGCDKGVAVFYNPESILGGTGWDCQQIIIDNNGIAKILLETETVYDIVVDGENRKWIATKNGVYCFSSDGQKQIYHFTTDNSPLYSNTIFDIEYDGKTGDLFFATTDGIISYRSEVIDAYEEFTEVYSYPNPVRPGYDGPVVIKGMIKDAVVKITDITGTVVYETTSKGGQAVWNAKNFRGERVASGVYIVMCASTNGEQKALTKILVVN